MASEASQRGRGGQGLSSLVLTGVLVSVVLSGGLNYLVSLVHTTSFSLNWYHNAATRFFDRSFVVTDLAGTALITGSLTAVLVGLFLYHRWDGHHIARVSRRNLLLHDPRSRTLHLLIITLLVGFAAAILAVLTTLIVVGVTAHEGFTDAEYTWAKVLTGAVVGAVAAWYTTVSIVENLSHGMLLDTRDQGNVVARISLWSSKNSTKVIVAALVVTMLLGIGIPKIQANVNVADILPRGDPNTAAAYNITNNFKSGYTQQAEIFFNVNPTQCARDAANLTPDPTAGSNCGNITDEVYIRAIQEFYHFFQTYHEPAPAGKNWNELSAKEKATLRTPFRYQIALPTFWSLVNWTAAGGQNASDSSFSLPPPSNRPLWHIDNKTAWATPSIKSSFEPIINPNHTQTVGLYMALTNTSFSQEQIGRFAIDARNAYVHWAEKNATFKVFTGANKPTMAADPVVANAHASRLEQQDLSLLLPIIIYFLIITLFVAFRNVRSVLIAGGSLGLSVIWTYGLMGDLNIPLNSLNLTVVPLIMGNGIDYAIHMINEFIEHKSAGMSDAEALQVAGERGGLAMFIATLTTVSGLLVMVVSPSIMLAQLGLLAAFAMASTYLLTITFVPAVLTYVKGTDRMGKEYRPSRVIPAVGSFIHRHRAAFSIFLVVITLASVVSVGNLKIESFGNSALNFPQGDWLRNEHVKSLDTFYGIQPGQSGFKTNVVVIQGDITDYDTLQYIDALSANLAHQANVTHAIDMSTSRDLPFLIRVWLTVKDGATSVPTGTISQQLGMQGQQSNPANEFPKSRAAIAHDYDRMYHSPLNTFGSLFLNYPTNNITVITVAVKSGSYDNAVQGWDAVQAAIKQTAPMKPNDVHTSFVGLTPTNYLFVHQELPWLQYMSIVSSLVVIILVFGFTRDWRATITVGLLMTLTSLWLLAALPLLHIGLAITLMLPLVFLFSIGSDYAVHLTWNFRKVGNVHQVYQTVGKAVLFSALTDFGAFFLFTPFPGIPSLHGIQDLMVRQAMTATYVAIAIIFVGTLLVTSLFYDPTPQEVEEPRPAAAPGPGNGGDGPPHEVPRSLPRVTVRSE